MEGGGEGMVAVVKGLKRSGLMVTILPNIQRLEKIRRCEDGRYGFTRVSLSNVETNTDRTSKNSRICDLKNAGSLQFGDNGTQLTYLPLPIHRPEVPRRRVSYAIFRPANPFADSLRKYPAVSDNNGGSELIQRILTYTQAKNLRKRSYSKSMRTLLRKSSSQQTYKQTKKWFNRESNPTPTETDRHRVPVNTSESDIGDESLNERVNYTYDYLKSRSQNKTTDVRFFSEVKNALRGRFKCMDDKPMMCPKMQNRFSRHKKHFHGSLKSMTKQKSLRNPCFCFQPKPCSCEKPETKSLKDNLEMAINDWVNSLPVYPSFNIEGKMKLDEIVVKLLEGLTKLLQEDDFDLKAQGEIISCLKEMPIWQPKETEDQLVFNNKLAESLLDSITRGAKNIYEEHKMVGDQVFDEMNYDEVYKLVDNFVSSLKSLADRSAINDKHRHALKSKIVELLSELPVHYDKASDEALNELAQKFINKLLVLSKHDQQNSSYKSEIIDEIQKIVLDWLTNINQLSTTYPMDLKIKAFPLIEKLKENVSASLQGTDASEEIQQEINKWLDKTVQKINSEIENKIKYKLSRQLLEKLLHLNDFKNSTKGPSQGDISDKFFQEVMDWLKDIPKLGENMKDGFKYAQLLANKLNDIEKQEKDFKALQTNMKEEILNWLRNMLDINSIEIDSINLENFANKLLAKVLKFSKQKIIGEYDQYFKTIASWLDDISSINPRTDIKQLVNDLAASLNTISTNANKVIAKNEAQNKIKEWISHLCDKYGILVDDNDVQKLENKILLPAEILPTHRKRWSRFNSSEDSVYDEISKLIDNIDKDINKTTLNDLKQKINQLVKKVSEGQLANENYLLSEIQNILTEATNLFDQEKKHFADAILNTIKSSLPKVTLKYDNDIKNISESKKKEGYSPNRNCDSKYQAGDIPQEPNWSDRNAMASESEGNNLKDNKVNSSTPNLNTIKSSTLVKDTSKADKQNEQSISRNPDKFQNVEIQDQNITKPTKKNIFTSTPRSSRDKASNFITNDSLSNVYGENNLDQFEFDSQGYFNKIQRIISDWIDSFELQISEIERNKLLNDISADVVERKKYLQLAQKTATVLEELEYIKFLIFRTLNKLKNNIELGHILSKIEVLHTRLQTVKVPPLIKGVTKHNVETMATLTNNLQSCILKWIQGIPSAVLKSKSRLYLEHMIDELLNNIEPISTIITSNSYDSIDTELSRWLHKIVKDDIDKKHFEALVGSLRGFFKDTHDTWTTDSIKLKSPEYKCNFEALPSTFKNVYDTIENWCKNLPIYIGSSPEDKEREKSVKRILLRKLLDKVAQINLDPEVLTNDSLYDEILQTEIESLIKSLPFKTDEIFFLSNYKLNLINKLKQAREKVQKQFKTMAYKQMLRSTISRSLPNIEDTLMEDNNLIEALIDSLVDAFINLQYVADDENVRFEYKNKLYNEVNKFCNDYLTRYPASPLSSIQLNQILYNALKNVSVPNDDSIRSVAEKIRIKNLITKWFNNLLMDRTVLTNFQINKLISLLANRLYDIEKNKELNNTEDSMRTVISEWLHKLLTTFDETFDSLQIINNLLNMLKATEMSRKNLTPRTRSNFEIENDKTKSRENSYHENTKNDSMIQSAMHHATNTLNKEERETLERVRARSNPNTRKESVLSKNNQKNVPVGIPVETGTQTDNLCQTDEQIIQTSRLSLLERPSFMQEISPQVIVKEFYWDTNDSLQGSQIIMPRNQTKYIAPTSTPQETHINSQDKRFSIQSSIAEVPHEIEVDKLPDAIRNKASFSIPRDSPQQRRSKDISFIKASSTKSKPETLRPYLNEHNESENRNRSSIESVKGRPNLPLDSQTLYDKRSDIGNQFNSHRSYQKDPPIEMIRSLDSQRPHKSASNERNFRQECYKDNHYLEDDLPPLQLEEDDCRRNKVLVVPKDFEIRQETKQLCCRCKDRMLTKCRSRYHENCRQQSNSLWKYCSKCHGECCPYPSRLYFK